MVLDRTGHIPYDSPVRDKIGCFSDITVSLAPYTIMENYVTVQIPSSVAIHLKNQFTHSNSVFLLYTAYRTNKNMDPVLQLEGIYRYHEDASYAAGKWISKKDNEAYGTPVYCLDNLYSDQTNGRCCKYSTPLPEEKEEVFWAWTVEEQLR